MTGWGTRPHHHNAKFGASMKQMTPLTRLASKSMQLTLASVALCVAVAQPAQAQEKVLRVAMTAADIPRTLGQPDQGFEGNRFTGIPMYDALTHWDLSKSDAPSVLIPGLATSWAVDAKDKTKWVFKLRPGVRFHNGSEFTAKVVRDWLGRIGRADALHRARQPLGERLQRALQRNSSHRGSQR
mgnify:CR=1 FL=1